MQKDVPKEWGCLAVIWDKNEMEASGYAAVMADLCNEDVLMAAYYDDDADPPVKFIDGNYHPKVNADNRYHASSYRGWFMASCSCMFPIRHQRALETYPRPNKNPRHE